MDPLGIVALTLLAIEAIVFGTWLILEVLYG